MTEFCFKKSAPSISSWLILLTTFTKWVTQKPEKHIEISVVAITGIEVPLAENRMLESPLTSGFKYKRKRLAKLALIIDVTEPVSIRPLTVLPPILTAM